VKVLVRRLLLPVVLLPALCALLALRTASRGEGEMLASDRAFEAGELEPALRHARRAAAAYVPGAAHVEAAYARLALLARSAEDGGDTELAARAWEAVRASALESQHLWQPRPVDLEQARVQLERLRGVAPGRAADAPRPVRPSWALLLAAGFVGAGASLFWFCARAWSASGAWTLQRARWPVLGWCAGVLALGWALLHA
jgi:hypothetical protein